MGYEWIASNYPDTDLVDTNIKDGVDIFGVEWTYTWWAIWAMWVKYLMNSDNNYWDGYWLPVIAVLQYWNDLISCAWSYWSGTYRIWIWYLPINVSPLEILPTWTNALIQWNTTDGWTWWAISLSSIYIDWDDIYFNTYNANVWNKHAVINRTTKTFTNNQSWHHTSWTLIWLVTYIDIDGYRYTFSNAEIDVSEDTRTHRCLIAKL